MDDQNEKSGGLIRWFVNNHVAANILMMLFIFGGIISVSKMRTETFPTIDPRLVTVSVVYPGATPYEVADSITRRVEEELIGIEGVKRVASTALEGYGVVNIELLDFADANEVYDDVETAVNGLINFPPQNAERPIVKKVKATPNVITLAIHGDVEESALRYWVDLIETELRQLPKVALTKIRGIRDYQISIEVSEFLLRKYNLSLNDVSLAIKNSSLDIPAGTIEARQKDILLRVQEKRYTGKEFENIVIKTLNNGSSLYLKDVAKIVDGFEDVNLISKFNSQKAAFIDIKRSESEDTLQVAKEVKNYLKEVKLPSNLHLTLQNDATINLKDRISLMLRNGLIGFMLVFLILLLFLDLKLAFWTSAAIPISFLGGLMIMDFMGYSLNMITLFALIVVLGIVVDDGIVTGESIFEAQESSKKGSQLVLKGVLAVISPVTIGVLTTMAAFFPLAFSTGTLGQIIGIIPVVVISILFVSLLEAYFILPSHLSSSSRWSRGIMSDIRSFCATALKKFIENKLTPFAKFSFRFRYATIALFIAIFIMTFGLLKSGTIRFVFFPQVESDKITITTKMPVGTSFEETTQTILKMEELTSGVFKEIDGEKEVSAMENISITIGQTTADSSPGGGKGAEYANNVGQIIIQLVPSDFRDKSASQIERMIRKKIENLPNIKTLEFQSSLVGNQPDIEIELSHPDEKKLKVILDQLKEEIKNINGTKEIADSFEQGKLEYIFKINKEGLAVGLTPASLGAQLRSAYFGLEALRFQRQKSEVIVYVRYPKNEREKLSTLNNTRIRLPNNQEVPLKSIATIQERNGYSKILTVDGKRIVSLTADADLSITTPNDIIEILQEKILPKIKSRYQDFSYSFEGKTREQREDMASLGKNMLIALMIIYVLLGSQLRSYIQPVIIMMAIPFGIVGAILGHFILGHDLTFISMFGIVALSGVVINDSVVLIDFMNHEMKEKDVLSSAISAIQRRFRPILLTTLSTSLGLLPMLLETSVQAQFLIPMVISLATGILFATFVILFLIPCLVLIVDDVKKLFSSLSNANPHL